MDRLETNQNTPKCPPGLKSPQNTALSRGFTTIAGIALYCDSGRGTERERWSRTCRNHERGIFPEDLRTAGSRETPENPEPGSTRQTIPFKNPPSKPYVHRGQKSGSFSRWTGRRSSGTPRNVHPPGNLPNTRSFPGVLRRSAELLFSTIPAEEQKGNCG